MCHIGAQQSGTSGSGRSGEELPRHCGDVLTFAIGGSSCRRIEPIASHDAATPLIRRSLCVKQTVDLRIRESDEHNRHCASREFARQWPATMEHILAALGFPGDMVILKEACANRT